MPSIIELIAAVLLLVAPAAAGTDQSGGAAESGRAGVNLEWPEPPQSRRYRVGDVLLAMRNDIDAADPSILRRSLRIEMPGFPPYEIDPGEDDAYEPQVMVAENPSGPPTILFQTYSGGAHCCTTITAIVPRAGRLEGVVVYAGDGGPLDQPPTDRDGDGLLDFVSYDNAFLYRFASYADSFPPPRVINIVGGEAVDVSDRPAFRPLFEEARRDARRLCVEEPGGAPNGVCAAYVATAARVGRFDEAWAEMLRAYDRTSDWGLEGVCRVPLVDGECPAGREQSFATYPEALRQFLIDTGYIGVD